MLAAVSCGESETVEQTMGSNETTSAAPVGTADPLMDDLAEFDFGGYEYRVLSVTYDPNSYLTLFDTEENGEVLDDALVKRNREIEERFNIRKT